MRFIYIVSILLLVVQSQAANLSSSGTITVLKPFAIRPTTSGSQITLPAGRFSMSMAGYQPFGSETPSAIVRIGNQSVGFISFSDESGFYTTTSQGQSFNMFASEVRGNIRKLTVQFLVKSGSVIAIYRGSDEDFDYKSKTDAYNGSRRLRAAQTVTPFRGCRNHYPAPHDCN